MTKEVITFNVAYIPGHKCFLLSMVYAYNSRAERKSLWSYLANISRGCHLPWLVVGDFNSVLRIDDRIGGNPITVGEIMDFHECVEECELIELPQQGSRYTWNDRHGQERIDSKIDWVFVNRSWLDNMPSYIANFLPEGISDHSPVSISLLNLKNNRQKAFKYCNTWSQHPQFLVKVE
ncbi:uncharacterized protein [Nicotiana tomentosiformis]|uniref:uncharacterized protein n=1 Tax=Nicotiana tomentosiformis TaxID=4098 RepID=UPI00388CEAA6